MKEAKYQSIINRLVLFNKKYDKDMETCLQQEEEWKNKHGKSNADIEARRLRLVQ